MIKQILAVAALALSFQASADPIDVDWTHYQVPFAQQVNNLYGDSSTWTESETENYDNYVDDLLFVRNQDASRSQIDQGSQFLFGDLEYFSVSAPEKDFVRSAAFLVNAKIYQGAKKAHNDSRANKATNNAGKALVTYVDSRHIWNYITGGETGYYGRVTDNALVRDGRRGFSIYND